MRTAILVAAMALAALPPPAAADEAVWAALRSGGHVVLIRHAVTTPGTGDPPGFRLEDCATQRNLTGAGRADARRLGDAFRARGVPVGDVLASPWCRCLETARLAFGRAEPWAPLGNLFGRRDREAEQVAALRARVSVPPGRANLVLVSHGSTIQALTREYLAPAELLVVAPAGQGRFRVVGRLPVDALR